MVVRQDQAETVYRSRIERDCREHALVLKAAGIEHHVHRTAGEFTIVVAAQDAAHSRAELEAYAAENRDWPAVVPTAPEHAGGWSGAIGFAAVLLLVAMLAHRGAYAADWFVTGRTDAALIRDGEWWRVVTALSLHVDLVHLTGNIVIGGMIGLFAGRQLGSGLAWFSILLAGALGNLLNAWIRRADHISVGASTAVFAALGMLAALRWVQRRSTHQSTLASWAPLIGGIVLLSFLGTGGARTDVGAHVCGFFCGALVGTLYGKLGDRVMLGPGPQLLLGLAALAVLALAWAFALGS